MLGTPLDRRIRRTLAVTVDAGLALTLDDTASDYFPAHVDEPEADNGLLDGSPRTSRSVWRLFYMGAYVQFGACDRFQAYPDTVAYELIAVPKPVSNGRQVLGHSAPCLPVPILYPRTADLRELGSEETVATVECAVYSAREGNNQRGSYEDTFIDLPPAAWPHMAALANPQLHFGDGSVWSLHEATLGPELPYVSGSIRKVA